MEQLAYRGGVQLESPHFPPIFGRPGDGSEEKVFQKIRKVVDELIKLKEAKGLRVQGVK